TFFAALYRNAPPEDVTRYAPESLAALADLAFEKTATRKSGETLVHVLPFQSTRDDGSERTETLLIAVNDDMPFLFDSLVGELMAQSIRVHALFHPIIPTERGAQGARGSGPAVRESLIVLALDLLGEEQRKNVETGARRVLREVKLAVRDWQKMLA